MGKKGKGRSDGVAVKTDEGNKVEEKTGKVEKDNKVVKLEKELGEKNLDDFLNDWDDDDESDGDDEGGDSEGEEESDGDEEEDENEEEEEDENEEEEEDVNEEEEVDENEEEEEEEEKSKPAKNKSKTGAKDQKNYISKLKEKDPEFFEFLKENDQELLNFDESSDDEEDEAEKKEKGKHKLPERLEVASDESDFEDNDDDGKKDERKVEVSSKKLNQSQVESWSTALTSSPTAALVTEVMAAFRGAVATVGAGGEESDEAKWKVEGGAMFNSVVRLAVVGLVPAIRKVLKLDHGEVKLDKPEKSKQWK